MVHELSEAVLAELPAEVERPRYDRGRLVPGIVHVGVGNFHRAHQAVYLDRLLAAGLDHDWAIVGAGLRDTDAAMRERLQAQDWLSTVVELDPKKLSARVLGPMVDYVAGNPEALVRRMVDPAIRIVSLTITEGGYYLDGEGRFDAGHPEIRADAAAEGAPRTVFGVLLSALAARRAAGQPPFTVMSCDNLPGNGEVARHTLLGLARLRDPQLADWIAGQVAFPNSMVDCITPATSKRERELVAERFGISDRCPVVCEPFRQWVMEDRFPQGRPRLEAVGVEFVDDVSGHELMKLRILNGGHAAIAYPAKLLGYRYVHEAVADPDVLRFLDRLERSEIIPLLPPLAGVDYGDYLETVKGRLANPEIGDTIDRLCFDGFNRQPKFILPSVEDALAQGAPVSGLALEVALWWRYCLGEDEVGRRYPIQDHRAAELQAAAVRAQEDPAAFLGLSAVFGKLGADARFAEAFAAQCRQLARRGTRETLRAYLAKE